MSYIVNKTNGSTVAIVEDASINELTDLVLVGRNYAGYGEFQNENFIKLLENFSNSSAPSKPIEGQLWFDSLSNQIKLYNGENWKGIANLDINSSNPINTKEYVQGDLWFNSDTQQLYVYNGNEFVLVGPQSSADKLASWIGSYEKEKQGDGSNIYNIKAVLGIDEEVIAVVGSKTFVIDDVTTNDSYSIVGTTSRLVKGITLTGADPTTGSTKTVGNYFWGTAAEAFVADRAWVSSSTSGLNFVTTSLNTSFYVTFVQSGATSGTVYVDEGMKYNPSSNILFVTASSAFYSDIAERYHADNAYDEGTVLSIGGKYDVTLSQLDADVSVAGIVSVKPAYRMNEDAGDHNTHPFIALKGRVPCKVVSHINKGDLIVTSGSYPGHGRAFKKSDSPNAVFAKALQSHNLDGTGIIEVMVV
ncbi:hypothetical protein EB118_21935 [bacterium]|nr:hypothetical protein [Synechococcaceae bacterium WB6_1A_059]NDG32722.1 hypothetical protein [bacterium]NDG78824.1 hypothetical protein [Synechococcaceae bacterium WB8_1B_057]